MTSNELEIFKQSILDDVRVMMQATGQVTQYIGARYVPLLADPIEWSDKLEYEPLTIVMNGGDSYTSRQFVPKGVPITNDKFWVCTGNYNAQIEQYRKELEQFRSIIANYNFIVTPDMFGGKTTEAIKAAMTSKADIVVFPDGTYSLTEDIMFTKPVYMCGGIISGINTITVTEVMGQRVKAFNCNVKSTKNQDGFPEWFNFSDDYAAAINKCLKTFNSCVLDATEYTIKTPIILDKTRMMLRGYNQGELDGNPPSRLVCTTGGTLIKIGDSNKVEINSYPRNITVSDINITGTPNSNSDSKGVEIGHSIFAIIERMNINDCNYAVELNGAVRPQVKDSICFNNTSLITGECAHIFINGNENTTGAAGNNASVYISNINSSFGGEPNGAYYSIKATDYITDTYINDFESNSPYTGIFIGAASNIRVVDFMLNNIVIDGAVNSGIYIDASNAQNCISGDNIYINSRKTGIHIKNLANSSLINTQLVNCKTGIKCENMTSCDIECKFIETELFSDIDNAITSNFVFNGSNKTQFASTYKISNSINSTYKLGYNGLAASASASSLTSINSTGSRYDVCNLLVNHGSVSINSEQITTFIDTKTVGNNILIGPFI